MLPASTPQTQPQPQEQRRPPPSANALVWSSLEEVRAALHAACGPQLAAYQQLVRGFLRASQPSAALEALDGPVAALLGPQHLPVHRAFLVHAAQLFAASKRARQEAVQADAPAPPAAQPAPAVPRASRGAEAAPVPARPAPPAPAPAPRAGGGAAATLPSVRLPPIRTRPPPPRPAAPPPPPAAAAVGHPLPPFTVLGEQRDPGLFREDLARSTACYYRLHAAASAAGVSRVTPDAVSAVNLALFAHVRALLLHARASGGAWDGLLTLRRLAASAARADCPLGGARQRLRERALAAAGAAGEEGGGAFELCAG